MGDDSGAIHRRLCGRSRRSRPGLSPGRPHFQLSHELASTQFLLLVRRQRRHDLNEAGHVWCAIACRQVVSSRCCKSIDAKLAVRITVVAQRDVMEGAEGASKPHAAETVDRWRDVADWRTVRLIDKSND